MNKLYTAIVVIITCFKPFGNIITQDKVSSESDLFRDINVLTQKDWTSGIKSINIDGYNINVGAYDLVISADHSMLMSPRYQISYEQNSHVDDEYYSDEFFVGGLNRTVYTSYLHNGELYIGGSFTWYNGEQLLNNIARWDGEGWQPVGDGFNNVVRAITVYNDELIAGGHFSHSGGTAVSMIARFDGENWQPLGAGLEDGTWLENTIYHGVNDLLVYNGELIACGDFTRSGSIELDRIARWDGDDWNRVGDEAFIAGPWNPALVTMTLYQGDLILGGVFTHYEGIEMKRIARWDGDEWNPMGGGVDEWGGGDFFPSTVFSFTEFGGRLYAGGRFTVSGQMIISPVARWFNGEWEAVDDMALNGDVYSITEYNGDLIAGGSFTHILDNPGIPFHNKIARWDGEEWLSIGSELEFVGNINDVFTYNDNLFAGGHFFDLGKDISFIALFEGNDWDNVGDFRPDGLGVHFGGIKSLYTDQNNMYLGGDFSHIGDISLERIARFDGENYHPVGGGFSLGTVNEITLYNNELIAGGSFTHTWDGPQVNGITRYDGNSWKPLGAGFDGEVKGLTVYNGDLIAGGEFFNSGSTHVNRIARWNGVNWQPMGEGFGFNATVHALTVYDGKLIAGGDFTRSGWAFVDYIAFFDGEHWQQIGEGFNSPVHALAVYNDALIAGSEEDGVSRWEVDTETWQTLGDGFQGVRSLYTFNDLLIAGGTSDYIGTMHVNRIAYWDGETWHQLGSGLGGNLPWTTLPAPVEGLTVFQDELYIGGYFNSAGGNMSAGIAKWSGPLVNIEELKDGLPDYYALEQNYPNPFNPMTSIRFVLPEQSNVKLEVYNILGQRIATLVNKDLEAGYHHAQWHSDGIASGVFFYRIEAVSISNPSNRFIEVRSMILLK